MKRRWRERTGREKTRSFIFFLKLFSIFHGIREREREGRCSEL